MIDISDIIDDCSRNHLDHFIEAMSAHIKSPSVDSFSAVNGLVLEYTNALLLTYHNALKEELSSHGIEI
jgi:hypothetical protein